MTCCANPTVDSQRSLSTAIQRDLATIRTAARSSDYAREQVRFLCNNIGPRLSGSPQAEAALEYVRSQMCDLGLDAWLEPVAVRHWSRGREEGELVRYPGRCSQSTQKIVLTALGNTAPTPGEGITATVIVVNSFEELDRLQAEDVKGKVVLFNHPFDEFAARAGRWQEAYQLAAVYRNIGPTRAAQRGASAALVRSVGSSRFRLAHTGITRFKEGQQPIPAAAVTAEDTDLIADLASRGEVSIRLLLTPRELPPEQSYNVLADLRGSQLSNQVVIISGHLDSWDLGTGALDDAAGVAIAMDVLRVIRSVNPRPRRTIRFVAWMDEENGGAGGRAYADKHRNELPDHTAAVELDCGDGRPLGFMVHASEDRLALLTPVLHAIADPLGGFMRVDDSPGADLRFLSEGGVPTIAPLQEARHYFDYHHTAADTFDKVRPEELRRAVEHTASLIYSLAEHN